MRYLTTDPQVLGGTITIQGTRTPVKVILHRLKEGKSLTDIQSMYPWIDQKTLSRALDEAIHLIGSPFNGKEIPQA